MKMNAILMLLSICQIANAQAAAIQPNSTYCNPLNLNYRFQKDSALVREAADPAMVRYQDSYYLFASKSGGYWQSPDMVNWTLIQSSVLPLEDYAPAAFDYAGELYFMASGGKKLFKTAAPKDGSSWQYVGAVRGDTDPALFADDDGRVYLYYGCQPNGPISGVELDAKNGFKEIGQPVDCLKADIDNRGWEVAGDANTGEKRSDGSLNIEPWIEGAWMTKHNNTYYLQYAGPGTQYVCYADGVYVADSPLGPFTYTDYSPASFCPTGFSPGAGHGCSFTDKDSHYWRAVTGVISVRHMFERRINLFAAGFDPDGQMFTNTYLADHPQFLPGQNPHPEKDNLVGWMLLSYHKPATASSTEADNPVSQAFDENIKTCWSAKTGDKTEWLQVDLGKTCAINALQINFAEEGTHGNSDVRNDPHQYVIATSNDGIAWKTLVDKSANKQDCPHDYVQLQTPAKARFVKIKNVHMPFGGKFALRGFRIFGSANGRRPQPVAGLTVKRNPEDGRAVTLTWQRADDRTGVVIRTGIAPDKLYNSYTVRNADSITISSLNKGVTYYFAADAINENGITKGSQTKTCSPN